MNEPMKVWRCPLCHVLMGQEDLCGCEEGALREAEEVEVIPVSAPNVLSVDEADGVIDYLEGSGREEIQKLWLRLSDWASKEQG